MLFPTTFIVVLFATVTPAFSAPIPDALNSLVTRSEPLSLEPRGLDLDLPMGMAKRDDEFYQNLAARDGELYEGLMARAPEPEMEDMQRRGKIGAVVEVVKKIEGLFHHTKQASNAVGNNNQNQGHRKRSRIGDKIKGAFQKIGNGIKNAVGFVAKAVFKRSDEPAMPSLARRGGAYVSELEARNFELETRSKIGNEIKGAFQKIGNGIKNAVGFVAKAVLRRSDDSSPLEARNFEETEFEARSFEEPELDVRSFEDDLEIRSLYEEEY